VYGGHLPPASDSSVLRVILPTHWCVSAAPAQSTRLCAVLVRREERKVHGPPVHLWLLARHRAAAQTLTPDGQPPLVKWSEHALGGFYVKPSDPDSDDHDWVKQTWQWIVETDALGRTVSEPDWLVRVAAVTGKIARALGIALDLAELESEEAPKA
jgi:hypothetical protein